jgi:hypothetical protein
MWPDILTLEEAEYCERVMGELRDVQWIRLLLNRIREQGGVKYETKPLLFELRFAYELQLLEASAKYEYETGVGSSTVDFYISMDGIEWLVELVSLQVSDAVKDATCYDGLVSSVELSSDASDLRQTPEAGMIRAQEKMAGKVFSLEDGLVKFPPVQPRRYHVILCDMRGYLLRGGDQWDYRQMAYGQAGIPVSHPQRQMLVQYWTKREDGLSEPIKGLFEESNPTRGARYIQDRIHFLGFMNEQKYGEGCVQASSLYLANWHLFSDDAMAKDVFRAHYPMKIVKKGSVCSQ